jgi:Ca2+/H+ antiporter
MIAPKAQLRSASPAYRSRARNALAAFVVAFLLPMVLLNFAQGFASLVLLCLCFAAIVAAVYAFMTRPAKGPAAYELVQVTPSALQLPVSQRNRASEATQNPNTKSSAHSSILMATVQRLGADVQRALARHPRRRPKRRAVL